MSPRRIAFIASVSLWRACGASAESVDVEADLAALKSPDVDTRREAIADLQTSDDPRVPRACLAMLQDEGNSTRRLALRAIGSRHAQIPAAEVPEFLQAIAAIRPGADRRGYLSMLERAEGLLARKYESGMFSPSPDAKYVVYERRGLACVLNTQTGKESLVGKRHDDDVFFCFPPSLGNAPVRARAHWNAAGSVVAVEMLFSRHARGLWVYDPAADRETVLEAKSFATELGVPAGAELNFFSVRFLRFDAEEIVVEAEAFISPAPGAAGEATEKSVVVGHDLKTGQARIVSKPADVPKSR